MPTRIKIPSSEETEQAVLGCLLSNPQPIDLGEDDFYYTDNLSIFKKIKEMQEGKRAIDPLTVLDELRASGSSISSEYIGNIITSTYSSSSLTQYCNTLKNLNRKRQQIRLGEELLHLSDGNPSTILNYAEKLKKVASIGSKETVGIKYDDVNSAYTMVQERLGKKLYGYSWGSNFSFIDEFTNGIIKPRTYRIGAPSNVGKTQFLYNVITNVLEQKNPDGSPVRVAFFTLENTREETLISLMCNAKGINPVALKDGRVDGDWDYLTELGDRMFIIDDCYDVNEIFSRVMSIKPDVVFLDYISLMDVKGSTEESKYGEYARLVPRFAKSHNIAWIDLSNLPINLQTNEEVRLKPQFYGSSLLKNNCDVAIHLMSNEEFKKTKSNVFMNKFNYKQEDLTYLYDRNMVDLVITKNRWGTPGISAIYGANRTNGGKWREMQKSDLDNLWAKFG